MKTFDFDAVIYKEDCYCVECCPVDLDDAEVSAIYAGSEEDTYPCCVECGAVHTYMGLVSTDTMVEMLRVYAKDGYGHTPYLDEVSAAIPTHDMGWKDKLAVRRYIRRREKESWIHG